MTREELAIYICRKVEDEKAMEKAAICYKEHRGEKYKQGIYFLYDTHKRVIYIGVVGLKKTASLYNRIKGNGKSAHNKKPWFDNVDKIKFHKFEHFDIDELLIAERLAIMHMGQPIYNDKPTDPDNLVSLIQKANL